MISDGDSSAYETVKHIYVNQLIKDLARSKSFKNSSTNDPMNENINEDYDDTLPQLSPEQFQSNIVMKEDCINHVKKRVSSHLKTLRNRYSGFESAREESLSSEVEKKKHIKVKRHLSSHPSAHSSSDDDDFHSFSQPVIKSRRRRRLPDGKPYSGSNGRMTKTMEHKLADYYGIAIRHSSESAKSMANVLQMHETRFHCRSC